ncbi:hypothetical protein GF407_00320 [candidate division KSB1 bacterium]|nr:hypothetical protein [candidate division KSB1 bacterium]
MEWRETADDDYCYGICVDSNGNAYITGSTISDNFPTSQNAYQKTRSGWADAFVVKLNPDGSDAVYSTYLGGGTWDEGLAITVDMDGRAFVTGTTQSVDYPTKNAFQPEYGGHPDIHLYWLYGGDAFVSVLNTSGSNLEYSTYIGGEEREKGWAIAVDDSSNAYVTGHTYSAEFPKLFSLNSDIIGKMDVFITKLGPFGGPAFSTLLGGEDKDLYAEYVYTEYGSAIFVDEMYNIFVAGRTNAADFPTLNAYQEALEGSVREGNQPFSDVFITRFGSAMSMIPDGVAYDPENWDTHVGELQSTFSNLKIIGAGLDDVDEITFKLDDEPDDYLIPQNINATATEVTFDLVVAHAAELGERDIVLRMQDGSKVGVTKIIGKKFVVSRVRTYYNQAVNQNSLNTLEYRDILVANKRGVARLVLDDEDQYNHTFTGRLKDKGIAGDSASIRPYEYRDSYSEQELIDARDDMIFPIPGPPDEGEHTLSITLERDDGKIFYCPDIKREFYKSASINVLFLRYRIGFADGQSINGTIPSVDAADLPEAANYVRKVHPISQDQLTYNDYGNPVLPQQFATKTVKLGSTDIVVLKDDGTLVDLLLYLDDYLDDANRLMGGNFNVIVAFMPGASLYLDNNNDGDVNDSGDFKATGCTLEGTRAVIVTPSNWDELMNPHNLGSTLAHELGHRILDIALETAELVPEYGENLGDEYKGGSFHNDVNPPILGNVDRNNIVCESSPFIYGVSGDSSAIYTDRSAFDAWKVEPKLTYLGEEASVIRHNFMGNSRADSVLWVSLRCYNALMKSLLPNVGSGLQKRFSMDPVLKISGIINKDGFGEINSVIETNTGAPSPVFDGPYTIEVCDAAGTTLASNSFGSLFVLNTNPPKDIKEAPFSIRMSKVSGAKKIILKKDGLELDSFVLSDHAPTIKMVFPRKLRHTVKPLFVLN